MFFFNKREIKGLAVVFSLLIVSSLLGARSSLIRERDVERNLDVSAVYNGVIAYYSDYKAYPLSSDTGRIIACKSEKTNIKYLGKYPEYRTGARKPILENLVECNWGKDVLNDVTDAYFPAYIGLIPDDPKQSKGYSYLYISNGNDFWVYGSFEGTSQSELSKEVKKLGLKCGDRICNFGKGTSEKPLEKPQK